MPKEPKNKHGAAPSLLGYLYQVRLALYESLRRLRQNQEFVTSIEALDDVVFEQKGSGPDILQAKHHVDKTASLTDASTDLWKTIRIWADSYREGKILPGSTFFLITTATARPKSSAHYLKSGETRDVGKALESLLSTATTSTNQSNAPAYEAFKALKFSERKALFNSVYIADASQPIADIEGLLREELFYAVERTFVDAYIERLEGWWIRRVIKSLVDSRYQAIASEELHGETSSLREQFSMDNLPIDSEIFEQAIDASGYKEHTFVKQLEAINISSTRIVHAIRNYFRAFEQRSRWMRDKLLFVGDLDKYEDRLIEEWELHFEQLKDELGIEATEEQKRQSARLLYKWVETEVSLNIRPSVTEPSIVRGSYQMLSDNLKVGWHPDFESMFSKLLETQEVSK